MDLIKTVLVGLDLSDVDDTLIDHIILASQKTEIQKVYFIDIQKSLDLPDEVKEKYPGLLAPMDEQIKRIIIDKIESSPHGKLEAEYELKIVDGSPTEQLLKWAKIKEVDLLILGKKLSFESSGISSSKIARLVPCSVFFIPEVMQAEPHYFIVPIDFSQPSKIALEQGINVGSFYNEAEIRCVHFYDVPSGYTRIGKSYEEFAEIMRQNAVKEFEKFIASIDTKNKEIKCDFELSKSDNVADEVFKYALKNQATGIIMGSRGKTLAASIILGSVAEKVLAINSHLPLFIAKDKNHNMGFFEALIDN